MRNPFTIKVISDKVHFCNRTDEIKRLIRYAENDANIVLYSPRRYGKTSLMYRVQQQLIKKDFITVFVDLFGLSSVDNIADRLSRGVYKSLQPHKPLLDKAVDLIRTHKPVLSLTESSFGNLSVEKTSQKLFGEDLLNATLEGIGKFLKHTRKQINIVFDEFQEIVELKNKNIEGILRAHIQVHPASYFFVGSRRRVLHEIFKTKNRAFFNSTFDFKLSKLPHDELTAFVSERFAAGEKNCPVELADQLTKAVDDHPYYTQKLCYKVFEETDRHVTRAVIKKGFTSLLEDEASYFEQYLRALAPQQIALLKAIAREPTASLLSSNYAQRHNLKSVGGIQGARDKLISLDFIHNDENNVFSVVDPIFKIWLNHR